MSSIRQNFRNFLTLLKIGESGGKATFNGTLISELTDLSGKEDTGVAALLVGALGTAASSNVEAFAESYHNHQAGFDGPVTVTDNGDGTISMSTVEVWFADDPSQDFYSQRLVIGGSTLVPTDEVTAYICADRDTLLWAVLESRSAIDYLRYIPYMLIVKRTGSNNLHYQRFDLQSHGELESWHKRAIACDRYSLEKGALLGLSCEDTTLAITCGGGGVWPIGHRYEILPISTASRQFHCENTDLGWVVSSHLAPIANNSQYQGPTGYLPLTDEYWTINYIYRGIEDQDHTYTVLSSEEYLTKELAMSSKSVATIPELISSHTELVGRIIIQKSATTGMVVESAFDTVFAAASSITDHGSQTGLGDNDHPQYEMVANLKSAAYEFAISFATATQGEKADIAIQKEITYTAKAGAVTVAIGVAGRPITIPLVLIGGIVMVKTAPSGSSIMGVIKKNDITTVGTFSIESEAKIGNITIVTDEEELTTGDYITVDITQIGSTVSGSDLSMSILATLI